MGGQVIAVDVDPKREVNAREQGAGAFIVSNGEGFASAVRRQTNGRGADVVIDMVASSFTMAESISSLGLGGRLVLVGYRPTEPLSASTPDIVFREIEIYGSHWATMSDMVEVVNMIDRGVISPIIIRRYQLEEAPKALDLLASGGGPGRSVLSV
jgi:D-arabinose 1-dehydrogenase-like Zn-dependent alcohol dehydrogenase